MIRPKIALLRRWRREGFDRRCITKVLAAVDQLYADENYETRSPKMRDTINTLQDIEVHIGSSIEKFNTLSPIGRSAVFEGAAHFTLEQRIYDNVYRETISTQDIAYNLKLLERITDFAANFLRERHSPVSDTGPGSGSAQGRDSDLRALAVDADAKVQILFRQPKDRFAVEVMRAVLERYAFDQSRFPTQDQMSQLLRRVWVDCLERPAPNFDRVVRTLTSLKKEFPAVIARFKAAEKVSRRIQGNGQPVRRKRRMRTIRDSSI